MDPAPAIGIGLGLRRRHHGQRDGGRQPDEPAARSRRCCSSSAPRSWSASPAAPWTTPRTCPRSLKRAFTGKVDPGVGDDPRHRHPRRAGPPRGPARPGGVGRPRSRTRSSSRASRWRSTAPTPRSCATSSRPRCTPSAARTARRAKFFSDAGAYAPTIGIIGTVMGLVHVLENLAAPEELGHLIAGRVRRHPVGGHLGERDLAAAGQPAQAARRARVRPDGAGHRGRRGDPVRLQPADHRPEAAARCCPPGSRPRPRRPDEPHVTAPRCARGGAREPRALAGHLRRHGHPADGAVHRDVRDEPGRPEEVQRAQGGARRRVRPVHLDPGRLQLDPRPARPGRAGTDRPATGSPWRSRRSRPPRSPAARPPTKDAEAARLRRRRRRRSTGSRGSSRG